MTAYDKGQNVIAKAQMLLLGQVNNFKINIVLSL